jgi:hypothetical protein
MGALVLGYYCILSVFCFSACLLLPNTFHIYPLLTHRMWFGPTDLLGYLQQHISKGPPSS